MSGSSRKTSNNCSTGHGAMTRSRVSKGVNGANCDSCDSGQRLGTRRHKSADSCAAPGKRKSKSPNGNRSKRRAPSHDQVSITSNSSYCCCGNCSCASTNRRSLHRTDEPCTRNSLTRARTTSPGRHCDISFQPVVTADGSVEVHTTTNNNVVVVQKTASGSVLIKGLGDCYAGVTMGGRSIPTRDLAAGFEIQLGQCHQEQGVNPGEGEDSSGLSTGPQVSMDFLGGAEVRFNNSSFPHNSQPMLVSDSIDSFCTDSGMFSVQTQQIASGRKTRKKSRSRSRKRVRPPDSDMDDQNDGNEEHCALPNGQTCVKDCRSPWNPSLVCGCRCHDPNRDVAWSSWPIFGPRLAAWIQEHRRKVLDRMRTERTPRKCR